MNVTDLSANFLRVNNPEGPKQYLAVSNDNHTFTLIARDNRSSMRDLIFNMHERAKELVIKSHSEYGATQDLVVEYQKFISDYNNKNRRGLGKIIYIIMRIFFRYEFRVTATHEILKQKLCSYREENLKNYKYHGTSFCTLFVMGKLPDSNKHALTSFGALVQMNIPCFVGECASGIQPNGVNQRGSSWTSQFFTAHSYATGIHAGRGTIQGRLTIEDSREKLKRLIKIHKDLIKSPGSKFHYDDDPLYWNRRDLAVRRLRHLDDEKFQKEFTRELQLWAEAVIADQEQNQKKYDFDPTQLELSKALIENTKEFIKLLTQPITALASNRQEQNNLLDLTPIIFASKQIEESEAYGKGSEEYVVKRSLRVGQEIDCILTEQDSIPKVKKYLLDQGLADRVEVVAFKVLETSSAIPDKADEA